MQKTRPILAWDTLLDLGDSAAPERRNLRDRLEHALRQAIDEGRIPRGSALPPSRSLAETLGVSRWVVTEVYGQLVAEGVLEARTGSATTVAVQPGLAVPDAESGTVRRPRSDAPGTPSSRRPPQRLAPCYDLRPGLPDLRAIPRSRWSAAVRSALADLPDRAFATELGAGHRPAREAVASYLARSRRVSADAGDIVITHGATDGMRILARELHRRGHRHLLVEDPSWPRLRDVAEECGLAPVPVGVDGDGVDTDALRTAARRTGARAALLTPAHQFPLGAALSPQRREQIVSWARDVDAVLIEDDYDAEFRYDRRPVAALQRLAPDRVALIGSLSKSIAPGLGLGWLVLPRGLGASPASTPSLVDQAALAHFLTEGDLERHLRRARARFRRRRSALLAALERELPDLDVSGIAAGMHLVLALPAGASTQDIVRRAAERDVAVVALERYAFRSPSRPGLVLGYGNLDDALVDEAVVRLAQVIRDAARESQPM
ncbi:PLP-dependent aminotransferase family protein [Microbacterium sp. CIAB417]|uniref:MocR-like pyridoxine biosynthesis transcription factor PdxR n=1 Tax=Microbacterium sp. CIAB417 TaxID=2860287 RepID=UPI001FAB810F|nr:PLP-dependent aminotransferase family protein [Microbacterium sp. CIAB417]